MIYEYNGNIYFSEQQVSEAMNMEALYLRMMGYKVETVIIGSEEE